METNALTTWFRYLPVNQDARKWGFHVMDAGFTLIPSGTLYPPDHHPESHFFTWQKGRILDSYSLVYITRGCGFFESTSSGSQRIEAGDVFVLFPGEWHRYRPDSDTGWDEYWVEFDGDHARRIMDQRDVTPKKPVLSVGHDDAVLRLFLDLTELIRQSPTGFEHIIATQAEQIFARMLAAHRSHGRDEGEAEMVRQACIRIMEQWDRAIDLGQLASGFGLGHSGFRKKFHRVTGMAPGQYQQQIRMNRACEWLRQSGLTVSEISERLGYESVFYFSRLFKRKTGQSPTAYRANKSIL